MVARSRTLPMLVHPAERAAERANETWWQLNRAGTTTIPIGPGVAALVEAARCAAADIPTAMVAPLRPPERFHLAYDPVDPFDLITDLRLVPVDWPSTLPIGNYKDITR